MPEITPFTVDIADEQIEDLQQRLRNTRFPEPETVEDWHEGQARGVVGSPHFFCGDRDVFCPSLALERDREGHLHVAPDPVRLEAFLEECWA